MTVGEFKEICSILQLKDSTKIDFHQGATLTESELSNIKSNPFKETDKSIFGGDVVGVIVDESKVNLQFIIRENK